MRITDLFNTREWDEILSTFQSVISLTPQVFDEAGNPVCAPCFSCEACRLIKTSQEGGKRCMADHLKMLLKAKKTREAVTDQCHAGFLKFVIPIFNDDKFLGITGGCNVFPQDHKIDDKFYFSLAKEIKVDGQQLLNEIKKARFVSNTIVERKIQTLQIKINAKLKGLNVQNKMNIGIN